MVPYGMVWYGMVPLCPCGKGDPCWGVWYGTIPMYVRTVRSNTYSTNTIMPHMIVMPQHAAPVLRQLVWVRRTSSKCALPVVNIEPKTYEYSLRRVVRYGTPSCLYCITNIETMAAQENSKRPN